jgi:hypothetical protein
VLRVRAWRYAAVAVGAFVAAAVVACAGDYPSDKSTPASPDSAPPAAAPAAEARVVPTFEWTIEEVDAGVGADLALTSDGVVRVAYIREGENGSVMSATRNGTAWEVTTVAEGGVYGSLSMAIGPDDETHVTYFAGSSPRRSTSRRRYRRVRGDAAYAVQREGQEGQWSVEDALDQSDGSWDSRIVVDAQGRPHLSAINPYSVGKGLEYIARDESGEWVIEPIEIGAQSWEDAASLAIDSLGNPHIAYLDRQFRTLGIASRSDAGWAADIVDDETDSGLFPSLAISETGRFHISYLQVNGSSTSAVKYATIGQDDSAWEIRQVGVLQDVSFVWPGPRKFTSLALDRQGNPWIAYSDERVLKLAAWDGSSWRTQTVVDAGDSTLGQLVSLKLDASGNPHLAYVEVTGSSPLTGIVRYARGTPR